MSVNYYSQSTGNLVPLGGVPTELINSKVGIETIVSDSTKETSTTATKAHSEGEYFDLNGTLVKATDDINIGDTLTEGTNGNYETVTVCEELESLSGGGASSEIIIPSGTTESTSTATVAHSAGDYFDLNGTLAKAIDDIDIGDTLVEDTNYEVTTICDELVALNTVLNNPLANKGF